MRRFQAGQSQRGIAQDLAMGRARVARILAQHEEAREGPQPASSLPRPRVKRTSLLDDYQEAVQERLARYGSAGPYVNTSGRNDIVAAKVSWDAENVFFYVRTQQPITPCSDPNWLVGRQHPASRRC